MNTTKIYTYTTTPKAKKEEDKAKEAQKLEDALFAEGLEKQGFDKWLAMKETLSMLSGLHKEQQKLFNLAMLHANQGDSETATKIMLQADTIERIINYARTKTPIY